MSWAVPRKNGVNFERTRIATGERVNVFDDYVMICHARALIVDGVLVLDGALRVIERE